MGYRARLEVRRRVRDVASILELNRGEPKMDRQLANLRHSVALELDLKHEQVVPTDRRFSDPRPQAIR